MSAAIDLTLSSDDEAPPPVRKRPRAPPPPPRPSSDCVVLDDDDTPCAVCGADAGRAASSCGHAVCAACTSRAAARATSTQPAPSKAASLACPAPGCGAPLGCEDVEALPPAQRRAAARWLAACVGETPLGVAMAGVRSAYFSPGGAGYESGRAATKHRKSGSKAAKGAGTGYGGAAGKPSKSQVAAVAKAEKAEGAADAASASALSALAAAFNAARPPPPSPLGCAPFSAVAGGGACGALRALLVGASLFDASRRGATLRAALAAVAALASRPQTLRLLAAPGPWAGDVPRLLWEDRGGGGGGGSDGGGENGASDDEVEGEEGDNGGGEEAGTVADALSSLADQAAAAAAAAGGGGAASDDVSLLGRAVAEAHAALDSACRDAGLGGARARRRRAAAAAAARRGGGGAGSGGARGGGSGGVADASEEAEYVAVIGPQTYDSHPLLATHYFKRELPASAGGEAGKARTRRIVREMAAMRSGLPVAFHSVVAVRTDEARPDVLQACVVPHSDTPYANGVFIFDILLPADYPHSPPKVQLLTTGGGRVRFNPNLYAEGKVCLSLLGTWKGPGWDAASSTLLQVLISIQSLIFVEKPWRVGGEQ